MGSIINTLSGTPNQFQADNPASGAMMTNATSQLGTAQGQQAGLGAALQSQIAGGGPNLAATQLQMGQETNLGNTQSLIAGQRGLNPALAARMGVNAATQTGNQMALQAALLRQQQQLAAQQQLQGLTGQEQQGALGESGQYLQGQESANTINAGVATNNANVGASVTGGLLSGISGAGAAMLTGGKGKSEGGKVEGAPDGLVDSKANDTVPAMLSPGEIVIPNSKAHDPEKAKEFLDHLISQSDGKKKETSFGDVLAAKRKMKKAS